MSDLLDPPPAQAEARAVKGCCSKCGGKLGLASWRCPWVRCRAWLKGTSDPDVLRETAAMDMSNRFVEPD